MGELGRMHYVRVLKKPNKPPQKTKEKPQTHTRPAPSHPKSPMWIENLVFTVCSTESERSLFSLP